MNILTFDIEDWFHILDHDVTRTANEWKKYPTRIDQNSGKILELLNSKNIKATFFCLGWIAEKYPHIIKRIHDSGHEIGTHSYSHELIYTQTKKEFEADLSKSIKCLEDITGNKVIYYRAPGFSLTRDNPWVIEILEKFGILVDCSIFPSKHSHGGFSLSSQVEPLFISFNGAKVKELPVSSFNLCGKELVFSGGGYFRLFPYWLIRALIRRSSYVMTYFHPRDFDPYQPIIDGLSWKRRFKSYYGLSSSFSKFEKLLNEFKFMSIGQAYDEIEWGSAPKLILY